MSAKIEARIAAEEAAPRDAGGHPHGLEPAGVEFIPGNGGKAGVSPRNPPSVTDTAAPPSFVETIAVAFDALPAKAAGDAEAQYGTPGAEPKDD